MIVLCGIPTEGPLRRVAEELERIGADYVLLNQRRFCDWELLVDDDGHHGLLRIGCATIPLGEVRSVYLRPMDHRVLPEYDGDSERCERRHHDLYEWFETTRALCVNRPSLQASNASKPFQAQNIAAAGLRVPETLITDDPAAVLEFRERVGPIIYKSTSGTRSIVRTLEDADLPRLQHVSTCPVQFQQRIEGFDVRVHRAGGALHATAVRTRAVDYRYAEDDDVQLEAYELGDDLAERCLAVCDGLGLPLAGIDLRIDDDGVAHCFEVNPSPVFTFYEQYTDQPIGAAVARLLADAGADAGSVAGGGVGAASASAPLAQPVQAEQRLGVGRRGDRPGEV